jgi:hypothetical protein
MEKNLEETQHHARSGETSVSQAKATQGLDITWGGGRKVLTTSR